MQSTSFTSPVGSLLASLNLSSEGIVVFEPVLDEQGQLRDMRIELMNDAAVEIFGIPREVGVGQLLSVIWNFEEGDPGWENVGKVMSTKEPMQYEWHTDNLGSRRWFDITLRPFGATGFAALYRETTERKRYVLELEAQQQFYEELISRSPLRKTVLRPIRGESGEIIDFFCSYANYGPAVDDKHRNLSAYETSLAGQTLSVADPDYKQSSIWKLCLAVADTGLSQTQEIHYTIDGKRMLALLAAQQLSDGSIYVSTIDISESRRIADALDKERDQLNGILASVSLGIAVFESVRDKDGVLIDMRLARCNDQALKLSGIAAEKYKAGALLSEILRTDFEANFERTLRTVQTGLPLEQEIYQPGLHVWIKTRIMKHGDGVLATIQDITDLKHNTEQVRQQAQLLEGILQASPHAILVFETIRGAEGVAEDFQIVRFNQRATLATLMSGEKLYQTTLFNCIPSLKSRLDQYVAVIETGTQETYEFFNEKLGLWRRITNTPMGDGFVMTMEDITEQKQIAQKIEESNNLLNAVLDAAPISIEMYEPVRCADNRIEDFRPVMANKKALSLSGLGAEGFLNGTFFGRYPGMQEMLQPVLLKLIASKEPAHFEFQVPTTGIWVNAIATPFGEGFISTSQDITEKKQQHALLEEQVELFNGVLSSLKNGLTIFRIIRNESGDFEDLEYLQVADSIEQDTGIGREDIVGKRIRQIYPGIEQTDYWEAFSTVAKTGEPVNFETHFTLPGYDNYLLSWVTPLGAEKLVSVYYIVNDLKLAQRQLEHTIHELRRSNEDLEQFASIASHDLQEPLRKVQSFGNMLESRYADVLGEHGRDLLSRMQSASARMRNLVTGLLAFARLSGDEKQPLSAVDLHTLVGEVITDLDQTAAFEKAIIRIPTRLPFVLGIEGQLRHLFHNLLTNALKFHKKDQKPEISIKVEPVLPEDAAMLPPGINKEAYLRVDVSDNGIGFEQEYAERIFGLFERLHGVNEYRGSGLGLSICRRVVEHHGGAIRAEGRPNDGATFTVLLKRA